MNIMNTLISNEVGVWIECCKPNCKKWRYSLDFEDPLTVPKKWYCHMNSDPSVNSCSAPEYLELDEGEIFVESKFKAGCIVWAKVIGHPWSPAMVDFCPEFETYYWFDNVTTNVPSQYHVTFFNGKAVTRAWIKTAWIKSFVENDPSFVLKSRVCGKKLEPRQQVAILKGCEIARAALCLTISQRLKKYNFNSWRLAQRFQNQSTNSRAKPTVPAASRNSEKSPRTVARPSGKNKPQTVKNIQTKEKAIDNQSCNKLSPILKKPAPSSARRPFKAANEKSTQGKMVLRPSSSQKNSVHEDLQTDTALSINTDTTISVERRDDTEGLEDTRSINSYDSKDFAEAPFSNGRFMAGEKQVVELRLDGDPAVDVFTDRRLSEQEITGIVGEALDEIIPDSQPSTPRKHSFKKIDRKRNEEADKIGNKKQPAKETKELERVVKSSRNSGHGIHSLDCKLKSMMREGKRFDVTGHKSTSENLLRTANKENVAGDSRYLRALSEFTPRESNLLSNATNYLQPRKIAMRKPLPDWFSNQENRRIAQTKRLSRLSKLSDEEDNRMYKENRESFIAEMESVAKAGPSKEGKKLDLKPPSYFMGLQRYENLLTSDEDSF